MTVGPLSQHRGEPSVLAVEEEELSRSETVLTVVTIAGLKLPRFPTSDRTKVR